MLWDLIAYLVKPNTSTKVYTMLSCHGLLSKGTFMRSTYTVWCASSNDNCQLLCLINRQYLEYSVSVRCIYHIGSNHNQTSNNVVEVLSITNTTMRGTFMRLTHTKLCTLSSDNHQLLCLINGQCLRYHISIRCIWYIGIKHGSNFHKRGL